jgi:restriction endonuclease S subunit
MRQDLNISKTVYDTDFLSVRVDKQVLDFFAEKPSSRWDGPFWRPKYDTLFKEIVKSYSVESLDKYISSIDQGDVPRQAKGDKYVSKGIVFINVIDVVSTGTSWANCKRIVVNHYKRIQRAEPKIGDLIFVRSGKGSIGKSTVFVGIPGEKEIGISGHLNTVRLKNINAYYVEMFLKSCFGQIQIERFESGTSQQTDFRQESFAAIKIPIIPDTIQSHIETEYKKLARYHDKAMEAKAEGNEVVYKKNIEKAETMLKELIAKTEAVIRGNRKDVI